MRLVSFAQRAVAAIMYEVEPLGAPARLVVQSELVANEPLPAAVQDDPRASSGMGSALRSEFFSDHDARVVLVHSTKESGLRMAAAMDHIVEGPPGTQTSAESGEDLGRVTVATELEPGQRLRLVKFLGYGWSSQRSVPAVRDQVEAALAAATRSGWEGLLGAQRDYLDDFWEHADVELEGDAELQQAVRFALFHTLQAGARAEGQAIPAKGLTGPGYDGHTFWDTETFVLQPLTYTVPEAARDVLRWRHATLDLARERAKVLGLDGAAFPWRTIGGQAASGYWPASTAAFHINADIAYAIVRYRSATADDAFEREAGLELLVETARLWLSIGHHEYPRSLPHRRRYRPRRVQRHRRQQRLHQPHGAEEPPGGGRGRRAPSGPCQGAGCRSRGGGRVAGDAAQAMLIPYDEDLGVHPQAEEFTDHAVWDFAQHGARSVPAAAALPLLRPLPQAGRQAGRPGAGAVPEGGRVLGRGEGRDFEYYEALTVRDSSLSAFVQAVVAAEVGHLELAYDYFGEAAMLDLDDINHNTRDGVHLASLAGAWIAAVAGFGGMRDHDGSLSFAPRLPDAPRLDFGLLFRGRRIQVSDIPPASLLHPAPRCLARRHSSRAPPSPSCPMNRLRAPSRSQGRPARPPPSHRAGRRRGVCQRMDRTRGS